MGARMSSSRQMGTRTQLSGHAQLQLCPQQDRAKLQRAIRSLATTRPPTTKWGHLESLQFFLGPLSFFKLYCMYNSMIIPY